MKYPYACPRCGTQIERICRLAEYEAEPYVRCKCGTMMKQIICAPRTLNNTKEFQAFKSPVDGTIVNSQRELAEHNKRNGVINVHEGYSEKELFGMTKRDFQKPLDEERRKDLVPDILQSVEMLKNGFVPTKAPEGDIE